MSVEEKKIAAAVEALQALAETGTEASAIRERVVDIVHEAAEASFSAGYGVCLDGDERWPTWGTWQGEGDIRVHWEKAFHQALPDRGWTVEHPHADAQLNRIEILSRTGLKDAPGPQQVFRDFYRPYDIEEQARILAYDDDRRFVGWVGALRKRVYGDADVALLERLGDPLRAALSRAASLVRPIHTTAFTLGSDGETSDAPSWFDGERAAVLHAAKLGLGKTSAGPALIDITALDSGGWRLRAKPATWPLYRSPRWPR